MIEATVLEGDLEAFSAADALHWARSSRFDGRLGFEQGTHRIDLVVEGGALVFASTNQVIESFGRHLYAEGMVDDFDLAAAVVHSRDNRALMGSSMIDLGVMEEEELQEALRAHTINLAELPLEWTSGTVIARKIDVGAYPRIEGDPIDLTHLMIESARREDELNRIRKYMPTDRCTLALGPGELAADASSRERRIVEKFTPGSTIRSLYDRIGGSYHHLVWSVKELLKEEVLRVLETADEAGYDGSDESKWRARETSVDPGVDWR